MDAPWLTHLEKLAALDLGDAERLQMQKDLETIIAYAAGLPAFPAGETATTAAPGLNTPDWQKNPPVPFSSSDFQAAASDIREGFLQIPPIRDSSKEAEHD